jgi:hypothetical protein
MGESSVDIAIMLDGKSAARVAMIDVKIWNFGVEGILKSVRTTLCEEIEADLPFPSQSAAPVLNLWSLNQMEVKTGTAAI